MQTQKKLCKLMSLPEIFVDVDKTSDGYYMAMQAGDIGYNHFLGNPQPVHEGPGLTLRLEYWETLSKADKYLVIVLARTKGIDLKTEFGIPVEELD